MRHYGSRRRNSTLGETDVRQWRTDARICPQSPTPPAAAEAITRLLAFTGCRCGVGYWGSRRRRVWYDGLVWLRRLWVERMNGRCWWMWLLRRRRRRPASATDRLAGGIERARAVNTRRETGARSRHKGCPSHIAPAPVPGESLAAGRQRGRAGSAPDPSTDARSLAESAGRIDTHRFGFV